MNMNDMWREMMDQSAPSNIVGMFETGMDLNDWNLMNAAIAEYEDWLANIGAMPV